MFFVIDVSEEDLRQHFTDCGDIEDIRLVRDKATGIGKGFGYVRFKVSVYLYVLS